MQAKEDTFLAQKRADVETQAELVQFRDTKFGRLAISWYNAEIQRLTEQLIHDKELETDLAKNNLVKGELRAYLLITQKMRLVERKGEAAQAVLAENEPEAANGAE